MNTNTDTVPATAYFTRSNGEPIKSKNIHLWHALRAIPADKGTDVERAQAILGIMLPGVLVLRVVRADKA